MPRRRLVRCASWDASSRTPAMTRRPWRCSPRLARSPGRSASSGRCCTSPSTSPTFWREWASMNRPCRWLAPALPVRGTMASPARPGPSWRSTWPSRWCRSAGGTRPSTSLSMPWRFPRRSSTGSSCGSWRVISRGAAATWPTRGHWLPPRGRRSAGPGARATTRASTTCRWPSWRRSCASLKAGTLMRGTCWRRRWTGLTSFASPGTPGRCSSLVPVSVPPHLRPPPGTGLPRNGQATCSGSFAHWRESWTRQAPSCRLAG